MTQSGNAGLGNIPCRWVCFAVSPAFGLFAGAVVLDWLDADIVLAVIGGVLGAGIAGLLLSRIFCVGIDLKLQQTLPKQSERPLDKPVSHNADANRQRPEKLDMARGGNADDLKQIKGVGPGLEAALNELGIYHVDQIAAWQPAHVNWIDDNLLRFNGRALRDNWVAQAKEMTENA